MSDGSSSKIGRFSENALKTTPVNLLALAGIAYTLADTITRWRYETVYHHFTGVVGALLFGIMWLVLQLWLRTRMEVRRSEIRNKISNYLLLLPVERDDESFYMNWVFALSKETRHDAARPIYITPLWATKSFSEEIGGRLHTRAMSIMEELDSYGLRQFDGMFAIVNDPDSKESRENLRRYMDIFHGNLILLDMNMDARLIKERGYPKLPFVGSDETKGGEGAAQLAHDYFKYVLQKNDGETIKILILEKYDTDDRDLMWDSKRIVSFRNAFNDSTHKLHNKQVEFTHIKGCDYNREKTKEQLELFFDVRLLGGDAIEKLKEYDLIFASNDDTALGALDAIRSILDFHNNTDNPATMHANSGDRATSWMKHVGPRIIGYDGSDAMMTAMNDLENEWIIGTVDVLLEIQATKALDEMEKLVLEYQAGWLQRTERDMQAIQRRLLRRIGRRERQGDHADDSDAKTRGDSSRGVGSSDIPDFITPRVVPAENIKGLLMRRSEYEYDY